MGDNIIGWAEKTFRENSRKAEDSEKWLELMARYRDVSMVVLWIRVGFQY